MKLIKDWTNAQKNLVDNETPEIEIDIVTDDFNLGSDTPVGKLATIRIYRTKTQKAAFVYVKGVVYYKRTTGYGYCKTDDLLDTCAFLLNKLNIGNQELKLRLANYRYCEIGGNYHVVVTN